MSAVETKGRIFFLDVSGGRIVTANSDGSKVTTLVSGCKRMPDGIALDLEGGHIYWTNMGQKFDGNDGSIERVDLDGRNRRVIVPEGATFTPKQLQLDIANRKLYWCDREGMRVMRANFDGSKVETLVETGRGEVARKVIANWCVGIAIDAGKKQLYWTQKGADNAGEGRIFRAGFEIPPGETPTSRSDIEVLFDNLPEPIDLDLDLEKGLLYWTDRGDPPKGNSVSRAPLHWNGPAPTPELLTTHLMEGIGLALDLKGNRMFVTDLAGDVYSMSLDGSNKRTILGVQGNVTGIAYAELPRLS
jgi:sugar lactone lactonase YvrE